MKGPRGKVASNTGWSGKEICIGTTQGSSVIFVRSELEAVEPRLSSRSLATASPRHLALARRLPRQLSDSGDRTGRPRLPDIEAAVNGQGGRGCRTQRPRSTDREAAAARGGCVRPTPDSESTSPSSASSSPSDSVVPSKTRQWLSQTPLVNVASRR